MVYASSAAVYGDVPAIPIVEATACRPLSAYGADKYGCELHARVASHVHGIPTIGLRFFNVYGPRQDFRSPYSGVISTFCECIRRGAPIEIFGDGQQTRDFIFVADVVAAMLAAMGVQGEGRVQPAGAPVFNVCTGIAISIQDLARTIADLAGTGLDAIHRPARDGEARHSAGSPALSRASLSLSEPVPLRSGLATVLHWLAGHR